jgi:putative zinc finger/helix-turn-helix YgiT family protein
MNSPITGKPMKIAHDVITLTFRKEEFEVVNQYYRCEESGEHFVGTRLGDLNMQLLHNAYRAKHNLPFPEEIRAIREKYSLSAVKMSEILGFGVNSYRQYEAGEVPSLSNGRLIRLAEDPEQFERLVKMTDVLEDKVKHKILKKVDALIEEYTESYDFDIENYLLNKSTPDTYTGYRVPNLDKLTEMTVYFAEKLAPYKTKMNKLLFYSDFLSYKNTGYAISGVRYAAINRGPVPNNFQSIFEYQHNNKQVYIRVEDFGDYFGEQFLPSKSKSFNAELFKAEELEILEQVASRFEKATTKEMVGISHLEEAWIQNEKEKQIIDYRYAFDLSQI